MKNNTSLIIVLVALALFSIQCGGNGDSGKSRLPAAEKKEDNNNPNKPATLDPNGDEDADGVLNKDDNCPLKKNADQKDWDKDGVGDVCDLCPRQSNPPDPQSKIQHNLCRPNEPNFEGPTPLEPNGDEDHDGIINSSDNCPLDKNPNQEDQDSDKVGDVCDLCPKIANSRDPQTGLQANYCDPNMPGYEETLINKDSDGDGIRDIDDNCRNISNADQRDKDVDGVGDLCDNCPDLPNPHQENTSTEEPEKGDVCKSFIPGQICAVKDDCKGEEICSSQKVCACSEDKQVPVRLKSQIMLLLDASGSMGGSGQTQAKDALDALVDENANEVDYGVLFFGDTRADSEITSGFIQRWDGYTPGKTEITLAKKIGPSTAVELKKYWASYPAKGGTPTGKALKIVRENNLLGDGSKGPRVVIVLTDGYPADKDVANAEARDLYKKGIVTYVVGVTIGNIAPTPLKQLAWWGSGWGGVDGNYGKHDFINAQDVNELTRELKSIVKDNYSCDLQLKNTNGSNKIYVFKDGKMLNRGGQNPQFVYDKSKELVTLVGQACTDLKKSTGPVSLEAIVGCTETCEPTLNPRTGKPFKPGESEAAGGLQFCFDGIDNNCDDKVDNCGDCKPETCDGIDNDCDGVIDNGCVGTKVKGAVCTNDAECKDGVCDKVSGKCVDGCRKVGAACAITPENPTPCCEGSLCGYGGVCIAG